LISPNFKEYFFEIILVKKEKNENMADSEFPRAFYPSFLQNPAF
jgi:hypothetical protein